MGRKKGKGEEEIKDFTTLRDFSDIHENDKNKKGNKDRGHVLIIELDMEIVENSNNKENPDKESGYHPYLKIPI